MPVKPPVAPSAGIPVQQAVAALIVQEFDLSCTPLPDGTYRWQPGFWLSDARKAEITRQIEQRIATLERRLATAAAFHLTLSASTLAHAPIAHYLFTWLERGYSRQCLRRMLMTTLESSVWHAEQGVEGERHIHAANALLIGEMLEGMEREGSEG